MAAKRANTEVEAVEEIALPEDADKAEETVTVDEPEVPEEEKTEETEDEQEEKPVSYLVSAGKSIMTKAGVKVAGDKVEARHFHKGDEHIAELLEKGFLEKV